MDVMIVHTVECRIPIAYLVFEYHILDDVFYCDWDKDFRWMSNAIPVAYLVFDHHILNDDNNKFKIME